ncbi:MAG: restriction endonuclease subunit S [Muribaculaceae bacterium]|nr:restriction endonuclease subunit S [Muribaculaceae bacterium]
MARQLYDYWFVQFDFPDENGRPYKSSGGKMVWNEKLKREMPEGWEVVNLFDAIDVQYGFPFSTELFVDEITTIPVVRIRDILNGTVSAYSTEDTDPKYRLAKGDVLIGMDGNFHMNLWCDDEAYLNQRSVRFRQIEGSPISALQVMFEVAPYIKAKEQNAKGSTVGHLSDKDLRGLWIMRPTIHNLFSPAITLKQISNLIVENRVEIQNLTRQRDELLPLLMNGQVSVMPQEINCDLAALILRRSSTFGSVLPNHLCATKGLDNQYSRFRTQGLLPRRKPHHNIGKCGVWGDFYPY